METTKDFINRLWKSYWDQSTVGKSSGTEKKLEDALNEAQLELIKVLPNKKTHILKQYIDALIDLEIYREKRAFLSGLLTCARLEYRDQMNNGSFSDIFSENSDSD